jgi:hypothetical protein
VDAPDTSSPAHLAKHMVREALAIMPMRDGARRRADLARSAPPDGRYSALAICVHVLSGSPGRASRRGTIWDAWRPGRLGTTDRSLA